MGVFPAGVDQGLLGDDGAGALDEVLEDDQQRGGRRTSAPSRQSGPSARSNLSGSKRTVAGAFG